MGAGKTTVGLECATRLGRPFVDTDDLVVARVGMPFIDFWTKHGEAAFREIEREVVADVCASPEALVVACGGGTVIDPDNRRRLRAAGVVVWLRAPVKVLASRVGSEPERERPLLAGDPVVVLGRLEAAREAAYEGSAHVAVDTADRGVREVATAVLEAYERERS
jgi:shikimate kinase